jgi:hypothetical protein
MNFIKKFFKQLFYKNMLTSNSNKTDLDELDEALLVFLIYIDCTGYGFFDKSVWKNYHCKYINNLYHAIQIVFKSSRRSNHHRIAMQLLVKKITNKKIPYSEKEKWESLFDKIIHYYDVRYIYILMSEWINPDDYFIFLYYTQDILIAAKHINFDYWNSYWNSYNNQTNKQNVDPNKEIKIHFSVLKIPYTTDIKIIKQQYRKLCFKYHPDCGGNKEQFIKIQTSYEYIIKHL